MVLRGRQQDAPASLTARPQSANAREADGSVTHVSPGFVRGNPLTPRLSGRRGQVSAGADSDQVLPAEAHPAGLAQVVASGPSHWELSRRSCQARDLGHPCRGCGGALTEIGEPLYVWKAATFIKRFHPSCAESFTGREPPLQTAVTYQNVDAVGRDATAATASYADAWRRSQLRDAAVQRAVERQATREAERRWPLYPTAGMLWRAGTLALQQERKNAMGVPAWKQQLLALQDFTRACGASALSSVAEYECAICLATIDTEPSEAQNAAGRSLVLILPCDPAHVFHTYCLEPWLKRNSHCPNCRADLRPLLNRDMCKAVANTRLGQPIGGQSQLRAAGNGQHITT
mmetsp:Transcript_130851/g.279961  ORF Transcript_130851/g.279961 Transcript_130851/m.279961 type:complete len:346 (-) Transcript_130851:70-1107(-)